MSQRLFEEFQKKNTAFNSKKLGQGAGTNEQLCISIPMKESQQLKADPETGKISLDEEFIKVIEHEYAVRYLEMIGTQANPSAIQRLLKKHPLSSCELNSGWNNSGALADILYIYPFKIKKKCFDEHKDELGFANKPQPKQVKKTEEQIEEERKAAIEKEKFGWQKQMGLIDETEETSFPQLYSTVDNMKNELPGYKEKLSQLTIERMIKEREEEKIASKWRELNMGIEQWKMKYLFPFGKINPITEEEEKADKELSRNKSMFAGGSPQGRISGINRANLINSSASHIGNSQLIDEAAHHQDSIFSVGQQQSGMKLNNPHLNFATGNANSQEILQLHQGSNMAVAPRQMPPGMSAMQGSLNSVLSEPQISSAKQIDSAFDAIASGKYKFPAGIFEGDYRKDSWLEELQQPLDLSVNDIAEDFKKFIKDFPTDIIPHQGVPVAKIADTKIESKKNELSINLKTLIVKHAQELAGVETQAEKDKKTKKKDTVGSVFAKKISGGTSPKKSGTETKTLRKNLRNELQDFQQDLDSKRIQMKEHMWHFARQKLNQGHIEMAFDEIKSEHIARLTGLISHFVYWCSFGHLNAMPLDNYHLKQLFISITQAQVQLQARYRQKKQLYASLFMPLILLAIRVEMEVIFKVNYPKFMEHPSNEEKARRLVNGIITEILDPQVLYSRFSFLESGKDAIDLKAKIAQRNASQRTGDSKSKFFQRSALIKSLIPRPSEGKVRAMFCSNSASTAPASLRMAGEQSVFGHSGSQAKYYQESQPLYNNSTMDQMPYQSQMLSDDDNHEIQQESQLLDLINQVQMFQIGANKVNQNLMHHKKKPIFNLQFQETFALAPSSEKKDPIAAAFKANQKRGASQKIEPVKQDGNQIGATAAFAPINIFSKPQTPNLKV